MLIQLYDVESAFLPSGNQLQSRSPKKKEEVRSPLLIEFGHPVDQNIHSCYYRFWPRVILRKAKEFKN